MTTGSVICTTRRCQTLIERMLYVLVSGVLTLMKVMVYVLLYVSYSYDHHVVYMYWCIGWSDSYESGVICTGIGVRLR